MLKDYMFTDKETGETFLVETHTLDEAWGIVVDQYAAGDDMYVINNVEHNCVLTVAEGEALGYDTY